MPNRINHLAVWVAAIAFFAWGALWFTVWGGPWLNALGKSKADLNNGAWIYVVSFLMGLILAYGTAIALSRRPEDLTLQQGVGFAIFMGVILYGTMTLNQGLFENRSFALWAIDFGYVLIGFAIIGAIVGAWKKKALDAPQP